MNDLEREYTLAALDSLQERLFLLPAEIQRRIKLAQSVLASHGCATAEEMRTELGPNWVIARRGRRIVDKYGEDVRCVSPAQYYAAERRAIERRVPA
jgi:hypothetical protein